MLGSSEHGIHLHSKHIVSFTSNTLIKFPERKKKGWRCFFHLSYKRNLLNMTQALVFYWSANTHNASGIQIVRRCKWGYPLPADMDIVYK